MEGLTSLRDCALGAGAELLDPEVALVMTIGLALGAVETGKATGVTDFPPAPTVDHPPPVGGEGATAAKSAYPRRVPADCADSWLTAEEALAWASYSLPN